MFKPLLFGGDLSEVEKSKRQVDSSRRSADPIGSRHKSVGLRYRRRNWRGIDTHRAGMKYCATLGWSFLQDVAPVTRPLNSRPKELPDDSNCLPGLERYRDNDGRRQHAYDR